jgi:hypothetical protein
VLENIPSEITIGSFSIIGILTGYIWNIQGKKIDGIKKIQDSRPCGIIATDIASIKNDLI